MPSGERVGKFFVASLMRREVRSKRIGGPNKRQKVINEVEVVREVEHASRGACGATFAGAADWMAHSQLCEACK